MTECDRTACYLDGELPAGEEAAAIAHIAHCALCQADVGDWVGLETAVSRSRGHAPAAVGAPLAVRPKRSRAWIAATGIAAAAVAAVALITLWPGLRAAEAPSIALADARSVEPRMTSPAFDRYRPYRVARGAVAREVLPFQIVAELERRSARAELAAAHLLSGDLARATAALDAAPPSAARDSDRAAVALAAGDPVAALELADLAITAARDLAPAHWNRGLALQALELPLAAAVEFDLVAARGEPGWAEEARTRAVGLRAPIATRSKDLAAYRAAAAAMIAGSGPPLDADAVRRHPGPARSALHDALAVAGSADEARALLPLATALDRIAGNDRASRAVAAIAARDFAARRRFQAPYRALVAGKLDEAQRTALRTDLARAAGTVDDVLIGALLLLPPTEASAARLPHAAPPGDDWLALQLAYLEARQKARTPDLFGAEQALLDAASTCRDPTWMVTCGKIDLALADLYVVMYRLDEAGPRLAAAQVAFARGGAPELEARTLKSKINLERQRNRDHLAMAYIDELRARAAGSCDDLRFADVSSATIAFNAGDVATARARLPVDRLCGRPPSWLLIDYAVEIARIGNADDRARAATLIEAARKAPGAAAVAAEIGDGRLRIDGDPAAGGRELRAGLAAIAGLGAEPVNADELRGWATAALIGDAARRDDWTAALAVFGDDQGRAAPARCAVAVSLDDTRGTAVVIDRDGIVRGSYQPDRPIKIAEVDTLVPAALAATLAGCEAIAVIARPPLHGHPELLPAALPWSFRSPGAPATPRAPSQRRVIVSGARPPARLRLPALMTVTDTDPNTTLVTGDAATPARLRSELADAGYIEIHAHGIVDASSTAFLALSPDADGRFALTAAEVRATRLTDAPVVVIGACRSGLPGRYQGARWTLPDAFLAAGARAVVASSTAIPDDQGATLFAELRARVAGGEPVAHAVAALRAGRLAAGQTWAAGMMVFE